MLWLTSSGLPSPANLALDGTVANRGDSNGRSSKSNSSPTKGDPIEDAVAAAWTGDIESLHDGLAYGTDMNAYNAEGWTPLLAACARGRANFVQLLLNSNPPARVDMPHRDTGGQPIHLAWQLGVSAVVLQLLECRPDLLDAVWELNGHTLLLQATFFGHTELVELVLNRGANTAATTVRGLGALELAQQLDNLALADIIRSHDSPPEAKTAYFNILLKQITPLPDRFVATIGDGVMNASADPAIVAATLDTVRDLAEERKADINALGGPLQQPPLVVAVTDNNGMPPNPYRAELRKRIVQYLLSHGADPLVCERHPMAVNTIIRAAVFNHLEFLNLVANSITATDLTVAINERPAVNGMTALHDTGLRASTASPDNFEGYLDQIRWCVSHGARIDIDDFSGLTQQDIATNVKDPVIRQKLLATLGVAGDLE